MRGPGAFDHARAQESVDARRECPTTSALTHFRERSRVSLLIADFCTCSSGSMHVLNTMLQRERGVLGGVLLAGGEQRRDPRNCSSASNVRSSPLGADTVCKSRNSFADALFT